MISVLITLVPIGMSKIQNIIGAICKVSEANMIALYEKIQNFTARHLITHCSTYICSTTK